MSPRSYILRIATALLCLLPFGVRAQINAGQMIIIGRNSLYFEDYMLSIQYFNRVIEAKPYLPEPFFYRSIAKLNLEDYAGAEADATHAIELNPFITDAYEVRGVARQNLGDYQGAIGDYRHALDLLPRNRQLMFNMALAQQGAGLKQAADSTFEALLEAYPGFDNGYVGRARLHLEQGDTLAAEADVTKALEINPNLTNAYLIRADIAINSNRDFRQALDDMDKALRLTPHNAGLYVNRAYLRYNLNDYFGAMSDYDSAIKLDPVNSAALFNRGLLLSEVNAYDRALADFSRVLELHADDPRARYNRAAIYSARGEYALALSDLNMVIEAVPDFPGLLMMRSEINRKAGNRQASMEDYDRAVAMSRRLRKEKNGSDAAADTAQVKNPFDVTGESADDVSRRFATLLTIENGTDVEQEFNNKDIRGKVQDRSFTIEPEPMMELSYHSAPTELRENTYYIKELDDLNSARVLRQNIVVTNHPPTLTHSDDIEQHFTSIDYYTSYLATHTPRAADYLARALDLATVHNYSAAMKDIDRAIELTPDFALSYMLRAQIRHRMLMTENPSAQNKPGGQADASMAVGMRRGAYEQMLSDIDKAISLSPASPLLYYNRGNLYLEIQDLNSALLSYDEALRIKPDLGEAYFNRGFVNLRLGRRDAALSDLSKAGELGVVPAYSLLKRMSSR